MKELRYAVASTLILLLVACGGSGGVKPDPNPPPTGVPNNSAVLSGAPLGTGTAPVSQLRKEIAVNLANTGTFKVGKGYATRDAADTETLYWFVSVTNESKTLQCFIEATSVQFKNSAGQTLVADDAAFVSGSVAVYQGTDIYTDTCLAGGQTGYLFGIELESEVPSIYTSVSSVVVSTLAGDTGFSVPAAKIIPQSYTVSKNSPQELAVSIKNAGTGAVRVSKVLALLSFR